MTVRGFLGIVTRPEVILSIAAPIIGVLYASGEYSGIWDRISGREQALAGLQRLESANGYPQSWIYAAASDQRIFDPLWHRLKPLVSKDLARALNEAGLRPLLITVGGEPLQVAGLPKEWEQKDRAYYSTGHPVLVVYGSRVEDGTRIADGKAVRVCSLGELINRLEREKGNWRFYVGTLMTALVSIALIVLRLAIKAPVNASNETNRHAAPQS
jgi:hypothetical protein